MPTFATPNPVAATVEVAGARVRITAGDRTDTVVRIEPLDATSRSAAVAARTEVEFTDGRLAVRTKKPGHRDGSIAITIDLPAGSGLTTYLAHSDVRVDGPVGRCELHVASGRVRLDRIDALRADIASGEVAIGRIAGCAEIAGGAFAIRIGEAAGPVGLSNAGGPAWIGHAAADLELSSASGDFDVERADAGVTAETSSGAIRIGRMRGGRARLRNASGDIEVGISEGTAASVDASSERGAVHDSVTPQAGPGAAGAAVSVFARTRHGDITVHRAVG